MLIQRVTLRLGYDVVLSEGVAGLGAELARVAPSPRVLVVTHPRVRGLHGAALEAELAGQGVAVAWFEVPEGEAHKSLATWSELVGRLLRARPDRATPVLAFGGGVVGDLAGFAAASVLRGLPLVQVPTTLLAAVDASVGGKTGVNVAEGKNLVGAFYQPRLVWCPLSTLSTLPPEELRCGLGEVLKHALIDGPGAVGQLRALGPRVLGCDPPALADVIAASVRVKAAVVEEDPLERGRRAVLNLGHTLGHAVEAVCGYGSLRHGEAVAIGIVAIARLGVVRGWTAAAVAAEVTALVRALGLPVRPPEGTAVEALVAAMGFDKKRARGMVKLVLFAEPGHVRLAEVPEGDLRALAEAGMER